MYNKTKVIIDSIIAILGIVFLWPLMLFLAITLMLHLNEWPLFIQKRVGYKEKIFDLIKLKTLSSKNKNEEYTALCVWIRKSSLDELPQLFNVLAGQMSLIGPRPLLPEYLQAYTVQQRKRHLVKPGISGLVQVLGGNSLTWKQRFRLDLFYVKKRSFKLDSLIFIKTVTQILFHKPNKDHFSSRYTS